MLGEHFVPELGRSLGNTIRGHGLDGLLVLPILDGVLYTSGIGLP